MQVALEDILAATLELAFLSPFLLGERLRQILLFVLCTYSRNRKLSNFRSETNDPGTNLFLLKLSVVCTVSQRSVHLIVFLVCGVKVTLLKLFPFLIDGIDSAKLLRQEFMNLYVPFPL